MRHITHANPRHAHKSCSFCIACYSSSAFRFKVSINCLLDLSSFLHCKFLAGYFRVELLKFLHMPLAIIIVQFQINCTATNSRIYTSYVCDYDRDLHILVSYREQMLLLFMQKCIDFQLTFFYHFSVLVQYLDQILVNLANQSSF